MATVVEVHQEGGRGWEGLGDLAAPMEVMMGSEAALEVASMAVEQGSQCWVHIPGTYPSSMTSVYTTLHMLCLHGTRDRQANILLVLDEASMLECTRCEADMWHGRRWT